MYRVGIDEVGRGPLAGPVVVAAVALPKGVRLPKALGPLRDSKKLSPQARSTWAAWVRATLPFAVARATPASIELRNISACANACALRCFRKLSAVYPIKTVHLDGGLYLGSKIQRLAYPGAVTRPKADEDFPEVALASIVAKEVRDGIMRRYHRLYPEYAFDRNVGYGTAAHYQALEAFGPCPLHRLTFLGKIGTIHPRNSRT